jgi:O-antigen/teichoic acid export membrane protein
MGILSRKILSNSLWMMFEKFIGIFGVIFVMSYVAKYIGPENFGKIALATTLFTFVQTLTWFGNQEILFKRVSKNKHSGLKYLNKTQNTRKILFIILTIPILIYLYVSGDILTFVFGFATAISTYFLTQDIYNIYNNANLRSHINALCNISGLGVSLLIRYIIVYLELDYSFLSIPILTVTIIPFFLKKLIFNREDKVSLINSVKYRNYYFLAGSSLVISSLSVTFYTQICNVMLATISSTHELGIYAAAITIGSSWSFVNFAIISSVMTKIYKEKNSYLSFYMVHKLNIIIILISLLVILFLYFFGKWLIIFLYGNSYLESYYLLIILSISTMLSGLGIVTTRLMIKLEDYSYISKKNLWIAFISLPISYLMISKFGLYGAGYSILLIETLSLTVFNYFYKNGLIFKLQFFPLFKKYFKFNG